MKKKTSYTLDGLKLKDRVEDIGKPGLIEVKIENPVEKLSFNEEKKNTYHGNFYLFLFVAILLGISILLNNFFLKNIDPKLFDFFANTKNVFIYSFTKPFVLTIGEYGSMGTAKEEAFKLLPEFKQIDIKQLDSGIYTFQIERFASKNKAYETAKKFKDVGYDAVHVRYLPDQ